MGLKDESTKDLELSNKFCYRSWGEKSRLTFFDLLLNWKPKVRLNVEFAYFPLFND